MATTASPYGLRPINLIGGTPFPGGTRSIKIASGYAADIFNGDVVQVHTDGTITKVTTAGTNAAPFPAGTVGIFVGCAYTDPTYGFTTRNYWPTGTVADDAVAYVVDDPNTLFMVQADAPVAQALLHTNMGVNQTAGNTATGNSRVALDVATSAATATIAFKVVGFIDSTTSTVGDAFTDVIVKFNPSSHAYTAGLGVA